MLFLLLWIGLVQAGPQDGAIALQPFHEHSRLSFQIDRGVKAQLQSHSAGFDLFFPDLTLSDLGAPLGEESAWKTQFSGLRDPRLQGVELSENEKGVLVKGRWKFPSGALELAHPVMEHFEYRDDKTSRYVLDFWVKQGPTLAQARREQGQAQLRVRREEARKKAQRLIQRQVASVEAKKRAEDLTAFCGDPLQEKSDVFLKLNPVHEKIDFSKWLPSRVPDRDYPYYEPKSASEDAQYIRLAINLHQEGRTALVLKVVDFFEQDFPRSSYRPEMSFLKANAYWKLGFKTEAERLLDSLVAEHGQLPVGLHSAVFMAGKALEQGNHLAALDRLLWLTEHYGKHRLAWVFHLGAAESLYALNDAARAAKEYQWVMENAPEASFQAEAASRLGDLYFARFQYAQALAAYSQAARYFKGEAANFPALLINRAEAVYQLDDEERAGKEFLNFIERHPNHPAGWRATYRLSEIAGRKAGKAQQEESRAKLLETVNRYPFSPGAILARMRLIPCGDHGGFDAASSERFFESEAKKFTSDEVAMSRYPDYYGLYRLRSLLTLDASPRGMEAASQLVGSIKSDAIKQLAARQIGLLLRKQILGELRKGEFYSALSLHEKYSPTLLPSSLALHIDPDFLLKLSLAASNLSLGRYAAQLEGEYQRWNALREAQDRVPANADAQDFYASWEKAEELQARAQALWASKGMEAEKEITDLLGRIGDESPLSFEKEVLLAKMGEKKSDFQQALKHALQAQVLMGGSRKQSSRFLAWIASLQERAGDLNSSLIGYQKLEELIQDQKAEPARDVGSFSGGDLPALPSLHETILSQGRIHEAQNQWKEAAADYLRAITAIPADAKDATQRNGLLYRHARALMKTSSPKDSQKAAQVLEELASQKNKDFWTKLASETLATGKNAKEGKP